jgi:cytosine/adenosine deaminase-related metal-dependent hydrolase
MSGLKSAAGVSGGILLDAAGQRRPGAFEVADGLITELHSTDSHAGNFVIPAFANAHDHARPISPTSFGAANRPLEGWLLRLAALTPQDPYSAAAAPFARAARSGCTSIMAHYTRAHGPMPYPEEVKIVAKAAADVGVQVAFAVSMRDMNPLVYGDHSGMMSGLPAEARSEIEKIFGNPLPPIKVQMEMIEATAAAAHGPRFNVQYGPNGMQWCSRALLAATAEASERTGRRVHMHFLETRYQREWADKHAPQGAARYLKEIGLLSPRLTLAHCVWASDEDLELLAEAGVTIATNASSNLHLRSGVAPIGKAIRMGCKVAVGLDGSALDEDDDMIREMRLGHFLHAGWGYEENVSREKYLVDAAAHGRTANGCAGSGAITEGAAADFIELDLATLDRDRIMPVDPLDYLFARATRAHVRRVVADGKVIVEDGKVLGVDLDAIETEMRERYRRQMPMREGFLAAWPHLDQALLAYYRDRIGCC